jgi:hypothetical protein
MIMQMAILRVGVPGTVGIRGVPGITGTEDRPLSIGLRGHCQQATRLALSLGAFAALGVGQEPECASGEARGRGGLGAIAMSRDPKEERFARGDNRRYSGWSSAFVIVAILVVLAIVILVYQLK